MATSAGRSRRRMASICAITGLNSAPVPQRAATQHDWFDAGVWSPSVERDLAAFDESSMSDSFDDLPLPACTPVPAATPATARWHERQRQSESNVFGAAVFDERADAAHFTAVSSTPTPLTPHRVAVRTASVIQWSLLRMREERGPFDAPWTAATVGLASNGTLFLVTLGADGAVAAQGGCLATSDAWRVSGEALDFCGFRLRSASEERLDFAVANVAAHGCWMSALRQLGWRSVGGDATAISAPAPADGGAASVAPRSHWACVARHTYARVPLL